MSYRRISTVGVIGAGTAGAAIAVDYAISGKQVVIYNRKPDTSARAMARINTMLTDLESTHRFGSAEISLARARIQPTTDLAAAGACDHVVESVPEDPAIKQEVLAEVDRVAAPDVVIASATSGLPVTRLAEPCGRPERVLATRFLLPAYLIPLVEVVPGEATSPEAVTAAVAWLREHGHQPVVCRRDLPGGVAPRLQSAVLREAFRIAGDGVASPEDVDLALTAGVGRRFGVTGIFERLDVAGLDTVAAVLAGQGRAVPAALADRVDRGELGVRTGQGFYRWTGERVAERERAVAGHLAALLPPRDHAGPEVLLATDLLEPFLAAARREYESCTPAEPPSCFALLLGRPEPARLIVERVTFGRNVRDSDRNALAEFESSIIPCFGGAYANPRRGFWCDPSDVLRISREAEAEDLEILGSIHLHPDWHRIGPPAERRLRISERPTPMDCYVLGQTGWPLNLICYLERQGGTLYHSIGAWSPACAPLPARYARRPLP